MHCPESFGLEYLVILQALGIRCRYDQGQATYLLRYRFGVFLRQGPAPLANGNVLRLKDRL